MTYFGNLNLICWDQVKSVGKSCDKLVGQVIEAAKKEGVELKGISKAAENLVGKIGKSFEGLSRAVGKEINSKLSAEGASLLNTHTKKIEQSNKTQERRI